MCSASPALSGIIDLKLFIEFVLLATCERFLLEFSGTYYGLLS